MGRFLLRICCKTPEFPEKLRRWSNSAGPRSGGYLEKSEDNLRLGREMREEDQGVTPVGEGCSSLGAAGSTDSSS